MKKYIQIAIVFVLVVGVLWIAKNNPVWAREATTLIQNVTVNHPANVQGDAIADTTDNEVGIFSPRTNKISISASGIYYIGGLCMIDVTYNLPSGLKDEVDVDVPLDASSRVSYPFDDGGDIYVPGCHFVHYKNNEIVPEMSHDDGAWKVCFAERPDVNLTVFYYPDTNTSVWIELPTSHANGLACATAKYTGEYAPGSKPDDLVGGGPNDGQGQGPGGGGGTVLPPPSSVNITGSGTYSVGGICSLIVVYKTDGLSDHVHVQDPSKQDPVDHSEGIPFPEDGGLLYLPGCHFIHYKNNDVTRWETNPPDGEWKICFAARPDREMKIYYYLGDLEERNSDWIALESIIENGMVCAPANFTGMYAPAGK